MLRLDHTHLPVAALTHPGMRGKNNEDRFGVSAYELQDGQHVQALLAVLSDGIGGHRAGEVAAEMTINGLSRYVNEHGNEMQPPALLQAAIHATSQEIYNQAHSHLQQSGMGATCACAYIVDRRLYTASVGDSRIYLLRGDHLQQLTTDHTWIGEALALGVITPEEAVGHPNAHVIRQFLGSPLPPEGDIRLRLSEKEPDSQAITNQGMQLLAGDMVLLTSDGLTDLVHDDEIKEILQNQPLETALQKLVDLANQRGGHDNITLVGIRIPNKAKRCRLSTRQNWFLAGCLVVLITMLVIILAASGIFGGLVKGEKTPTPTQRSSALTLPAMLPSQSAQATAYPASPTPPLLQIETSIPRTSYPPAGETATPWPTYTRVP